MEFVLEYPTFRENWYRIVVNYVKSLYLKKQYKDYTGNDLLID
jgi:hypothetical protein